MAANENKIYRPIDFVRRRTDIPVVALDCCIVAYGEEVAVVAEDIVRLVVPAVSVPNCSCLPQLVVASQSFVEELVVAFQDTVVERPRTLEVVALFVVVAA